MLNDLKVIELATVLAGPSVGKFLAEQGAQVVKYEPVGGDVTRSWKNPTEDPEAPVSAYWASVNWGKELRSLDLHDGAQLNAMLLQVRTADILLHNFRKSQLEKYGLTKEHLWELNPSLIIGQITGYGPESNRPAYDLVLQAESGFMAINGQTDGPPTKMPVALIDVIAGHQLKEGLLMALLGREKDGKGRLVSVSLYDSAISALTNQASNYLTSGFEPQRQGSLHPNIAPYGEIFQTSDGLDVTVAIGSDRQFADLCQILDTDLHAREEYRHNSDRIHHRTQLDKELSGLIEKWKSDELHKACLEKGVPFAEIKGMSKVFEDERAQSLVREDVVEGQKLRRVKGSVFEVVVNG